MWKSRFIVVIKGIVFHRGCGNCCGKSRPSVENHPSRKVFHISTAPFFTHPVEMWKTQYQMLYAKSLTGNRTVENFPP